MSRCMFECKWLPQVYMGLPQRDALRYRRDRQFPTFFRSFHTRKLEKYKGCVALADDEEPEPQDGSQNEASSVRKPVVIPLGA